MSNKEPSEKEPLLPLLSPIKKDKPKEKKKEFVRDVEMKSSKKKEKAEKKAEKKTEEEVVIEIEEVPPTVTPERKSVKREEDYSTPVVEKERKVDIKFGIMPFGGSVTKTRKDDSDDEEEVMSNVDPQEFIKKTRIIPKEKTRVFMGIGNILYVLFFGWYVALFYFVVGVLAFCTILCIPQAKVLFGMGWYYFWPFDKFIERVSSFKLTKREIRRFFTEKRSLSRVRVEIAVCVFQVFFAPFLGLLHMLVVCFSWFGVVSIPVCKVHWHGFKIIMTDVLRYRAKKFPPGAGSDIFLCVFRAINTRYFKYSVYGMNIILLNALPFVIATLIFGLIWAEEAAFIIFPMGLLSTVPLAYYIGMAVSSISSQSSYVVGAFFNALFGSIIELILYFISLSRGLVNTVDKAVTGSLLGVMLLMPGLSMFFGGLKYREQYFNKQTAGVSAVLLFLATVGMFIPTLFYEIYGSYHFHCGFCSRNITTSSGFDCTGCYYYEKEFTSDKVFNEKAKPLMWAVALILPIAYLTGLIFAFKTHKHLYEKPIVTDEGKLQEVKGHGSPTWTKLQSMIILLAATALFAGIAEVISASMAPGLEKVGISEEFAGLSLIGIIPNFAEFVNAVQFSLENNIILSLEIGSVAALQITLLQTSTLVIFSQILYGWILGLENGIFYLFFPKMDMYAVLFSVLIVNYIMIDGKANYFRGVVLLMVYVIILVAFFFELNT